jgi:F420-non-reducing hydrogenase large subunit
MSTTIIGPLRWLEEPSRVSISQNGDGPRSYYQVTAPRDIPAICKGRPVEELPRILSILSPSHHIASAKALDSLFAIQIPPTAENIRKALREALTFIHHSRKLLFLLSSSVNPLGLSEDFRRLSPSIQRRTGDEIMKGIALFQEAAVILGGRYPHPVTAIAGGVSRPIKEVHRRRLQEIVQTGLPYALRLRDIFAETVIGTGWYKPMNLPFRAIASITSSDTENEVVTSDPSGGESARFTPEKRFEALEIVCEPWTYLPFVQVKGKTWEGPVSAKTEGLFFVGPLARLNRCKPVETPLAEEERQRLMSCLGPPPHFSAIAGYWSMIVELIESAEKSGELFCEEKLSGAETRVVATRSGHSGLAAFEAPEGFLCHRYEVDERGLVEEVTILDAAAQNNGLRSLLTQKMVEEAIAREQPWDQAQKTIELSLVPF